MNKKRPPKILIVDDQERTRTALKLVLADRNFTISEATNGKEALEKVAQNKPDLIILDAIMPIMDGFELYKRLKENQKTKNIPAIIFTAEASAKRVDIVVDDYVDKPDVKKLCERIDKILRDFKWTRRRKRK
jgi:CheY-like chemotaxis protein